MAAKIALLSLSALLTACVNPHNVPLSSERANDLRGSRLTISKRDAPAFAAMTPGKATLGLLGAAAMIADGNSKIRTNAVADPADSIAKEIASAVAAKNGAKVIASNRKASGESSKAIASAYSDADYVIDVRTINWSCIYYPMNFARYRVLYSAKLRLIETRTGKVLCEGFHARIPDDKQNAPSYSQLWANNASILKSELAIAARDAVAHFKRETLRL